MQGRQFVLTFTNSYSDRAEMDLLITIAGPGDESIDRTDASQRDPPRGSPERP